MSELPAAVDDPTDEVTDLLRHLIRNRCVNDGTTASGQEIRSADLLRSFLEGSGLDIEVFEPNPGRRSVVARRAGTDPAAPTLLLMGHTDVVPVNEDGWRRDPFGAELVDGEVWGRGATDMLNLTASMAVAVRRIAAAGHRLRGGLVYLGVADEEAGGHEGAAWLVDNEFDAVRADYVITEGGGSLRPGPSGPSIMAAAGEKGISWLQLLVHGTPSHASRPMRTDNALVTAAEVVTRLARYRPPPGVSALWRRYLEGIEVPAELAEALTDPDRIWDTCADERTPLALARQAHACTHTTFAPTIVSGGTKINVIPDRVEIQVDVRTLPGTTGGAVAAMVQEAIGDLAGSVEVLALQNQPATESSTDTPLWAAMQRAASGVMPGARVVPSLMPGGTDARFFREQGIPSYGFGMMSGRIPIDELVKMFHGDDERIDLESLRLSTLLWEQLILDFLG